jgi:hypothetical protein
LEEEWEATLNFLRRTITSTAKPIPQVIIILDLEEEVEVRPQPTVEEQLQLVSTLRPMEEEELQQHVVQE